MTDPVLLKAVQELVESVEGIVVKEDTKCSVNVEEYLVRCLVPPMEDHRQFFIDSILVTKLSEINLIVTDILRRDSPKIPPSRDGAPAPPPTLLTIQQLRMIYTALEIVWSWGIEVTIAPLLGFDLKDEYPTSMLVPQSLLIAEKSHCRLVDPESIFSRVVSMWNIVKSRVFSSMMLQRNLKRILLCLLAVANRKIPETLMGVGPSMLSAKQLLTSIALGQLKSLVVTQLRVATKAAAWLRTACSSVLSEILVSDGGLRATLVAYLQGVSDDPGSLVLQINVVKLVTSVPAGMGKVVYLKNISRQLIELYRFAIESKDQVLMKVCVLTSTRIAWMEQCVAVEDICCELLKPIQCLGNIHGRNLIDTNRSVSDFSELDVSIAILGLHGLLFLCPLQDPLLQALVVCRIPQGILEMCLQTLIRCRSSSQLSLIQECCCGFFTHIEERKSLSFLCDNVYSILTSRKSNLLQCELAPSGNLRIVSKFSDTKASRNRILPISAPSSSGQRAEVRPSVLSLNDTIRAVQSARAVDSSGFDSDKYLSSTDDTDLEPSSALQDILKQAGLVADSRQDCPEDSSHSEVVASNHGEDILRVAEQGTALAELLLFLDKFLDKSISGIDGPQSAIENSTTVSAKPNLLKGGRLGYTLGSSLYLHFLSAYLQPTNYASNIEGVSFESTGVQNNVEVHHDRAKTANGLMVILLPSFVPMETLLRQGLFLLRLSAAVLKSYLATCQEDLYSTTAENAHNLTTELPSIDGSGEKIEMLQCILGLLSGILAQPKVSHLDKTVENTTRSSSSSTSTEDDEKEAILRSLRQPLVEISLRVPEEQIKSLATELLHQLLRRSSYILSNSTVEIDGAHGSRAQSASNILRTIELVSTTEFLYSDDPAMRAYGLHNIRTSILDSKGISNIEYEALMTCLVQHLHDRESFVYLSALNILSVLADRKEIGLRPREKLFSALVAMFIGQDNAVITSRPSSTSNVASQISISAKGEQEYRWRAMVGESLGAILRRAGAASPPLLESLIPACLRIVRERCKAEDQEAMKGLVNLFTLKLKRLEVDMSAPATEDVSQRQQEESIITAANGADYVLYRQSAISLLADAVVVGGWAITKYLDDLLDVAYGVLSMEIDDRAPNVQVARICRRAASFLLRHIVTGLGAKLFELSRHASTSSPLLYRHALSSVGADEVLRRMRDRAATSSVSELPSFVPTCPEETWFGSSTAELDASGVDFARPLQIYQSLDQFSSDPDKVVAFHCECGIASFEYALRARLTPPSDPIASVLKITSKRKSIGIQEL